jgi:hypothetical protein
MTTLTDADLVSFNTNMIELQGDAPEWLGSLVDEINAAALLPQNWDTYGAGALREKAARHGIALLGRVRFGGPAPRVTVSPDGDLQMSWRTNDVELEVEVTADGDVEVFLGADGDEREWRSSVFGDDHLVEALGRVGSIGD